MRPRLNAIFGCAAAISMVAAGTMTAQSTSPLRDTPWLIVSDPATDLWFHTMAVIGVDGPGTLPFYSANYAASVSAEKARQGVAPTAADRDAQRLRHAIMADSAFELLHFLPLYLDRTTPEDLPRVLREIAEGSGPTHMPADVLGALRSSLSSTAERAVLTDLADALADEWRTFYAGYAARHTSSVAARHRALQARWNELFVPRLSDAFRAMGVERGVLLISPPLGPEGRVVSLGGAGTIVAVSDASDGLGGDAPLLAAVRELCFPLLQRIRDVDPVASAHAPRGADESSRAAVQCGAQVVDSLMPSSAGEYRALYLRPRAGESPAGYRRRFDQRFRTDSVTLRAVAQAIGGGGSHLQLPLGR